MSGLQGALLDTLLKGSLLLVLAAIATRLLRHRSAAARHAIWATAILAQLALPVLSAGLPAWNVPLLPQAASPPALVEQPVAAPLPAPAAPAVGSAFVHSLHSVQFWLTLLWIVGGIALLLRLVIGLATVARLARRAGEVGEGAWQSLTRYLAATLRIRRPIRLLRSDRIGVPVTWGIRRPTVLLPSDADDWSAERRGLVLVHELAHIKRLDALTQLAAQGTFALFWINPLVWIALRQMAAERERACDDYVLRCGAVASTYAGELLEIVRSLRRSPGPALAALALGLARRSDFESRMLAILNPRLSRRALDRRSTVLLAVLAVLLIVPLAAFRPVPRRGSHVTPKMPIAMFLVERQAHQPHARSSLGPAQVPELVAVGESEAASGAIAKGPVVQRPTRATAPRRKPVEARQATPIPRPPVVPIWTIDSLSPALPLPPEKVAPEPGAKKTGESRKSAICVSFNTQSAKSVRGLPETPGHEAQIWISTRASESSPASRCTVNIRVMQVSVSTQSLPKRDFDLILAWSGLGEPLSADTLKVLQQLLRDPQIIDVLRMLAPPKET